MEQFKVLHFERETGTPFPPFSTLHREEAARLRERLAVRIGLISEELPLSLLEHLERMSYGLTDVDATSDDFDLVGLFGSLSASPYTEVFVNWDRFSTIDVFNINDLSQCFSDIWYPSSDDIEIFDRTLDWILFVHHSGSLQFARIPQYPHASE